MKEVNIDTKKLLLKLMENRVQHEKDYKNALLGYRITLHKQLSDELAALKEDPDNYKLSAAVPTAPLSYLDDYDVAIAMLDVEVKEIVTLSESDFATLYLDKWDWKRGWMMSNTGYVGVGNSLPSYNFSE